MANYYYPKIEAALVDYGRSLNLSPAQVADKLGVSQSTYYNKLTGKTSWSVDNLYKIARMTGATYEDLVSERQPLGASA